MSSNSSGAAAPRILIVGGGYAGFYTAWKLEKFLRNNEAEVTLVDPLPYMTYQPFLPEVVAGSIEPRHAVVSHRRHLRKTNIVSGKVTNIDHKKKFATVEYSGIKGAQKLSYDIVIVTAGAVSRTFPIPGVAEQAIGMKNIEEAIEVRNRILTNFDKAANLPAGAARDRLLTFVVVGGGFAGIEAFAAEGVGDVIIPAHKVVAALAEQLLIAHADPTTSFRALCKAGGNSFPRFSARRRMPRQAFALK